MYLYHLPQVYGDQITVDAFLAALDRMPTLAGAKFSSYRIDDLIELKVKAGDRLNVLSGCSEQLMSAVGAGADGSICTWYNLVPRLGKAIVAAMEANDVATAPDATAPTGHVRPPSRRQRDRQCQAAGRAPRHPGRRAAAADVGGRRKPSLPRSWRS